ncbi:hypothetical protein [Sphingopyxis sp.]|uniref:hypothetical protein n=1 Tax=Sphingopyxis sp. TaxID=1908224 RepID=UPI002FC7022B
MEAGKGVFVTVINTWWLTIFPCRGNRSRERKSHFALNTANYLKARWSLGSQIYGKRYRLPMEHGTIDRNNQRAAERNHFRKIRRGSDALVANYDLALVVFARDQARDVSAGKLGHTQDNILTLGWISWRLRWLAASDNSAKAQSRQKGFHPQNLLPFHSSYSDIFVMSAIGRLLPSHPDWR